MRERIPGKINNQGIMKQVVDFKGLVFGKISPTDIDCFIDFGNKLFVIVEAKHNDAQVPFGQKLAIERLCDATHCPPDRYSVSFIVSHKDTGNIDLANAIVRKYRINKKWHDPKSSISLYDAIKLLKEMYGIK